MHSSPKAAVSLKLRNMIGELQDEIFQDVNMPEPYSRAERVPRLCDHLRGYVVLFDEESDAMKMSLVNSQQQSRDDVECGYGQRGLQELAEELNVSLEGCDMNNILVCLV